MKLSQTMKPALLMAAAALAWTAPVSGYQRFQWVREQLAEDGFNLSLSSGN